MTTRRQKRLVATDAEIDARGATGDAARLSLATARKLRREADAYLERELVLKDGTYVAAARCRRFGEWRVLPFDEDSGAEPRVWLTGDECGVEAVVVADSFEVAYELAVDMMRTLDPAELHEAYGLDDETALRVAVEDEDRQLELVEGFVYNSSGNVVEVSHYHWLRPMTVRDCQPVGEHNGREQVRLMVEALA